MKAQTQKECEVLLKLFKDFSADYNANSLSKVMKLTPRGTLKIVKSLFQQGILQKKKFGKAMFYKVNFKEDYPCKLIETLLRAEAQQHASRWIFELKDSFKDIEIAILFGSVIRDSQKAKDVDVLLVFKKEKYKPLKEFIEQKNRIVLKPLHPILQLPEDIKNNLKKKDPVILNALQQGYVLYGYEKLIEVVKHVTSFE